MAAGAALAVALAALAGLAPRGAAGHGFMADPPARNYIATVKRTILNQVYPWLHYEEPYLGGEARYNFPASEIKTAAAKETLPYPETCPHCLNRYLYEPNAFEVAQTGKYWDYQGYCGITQEKTRDFQIVRGCQWALDPQGISWYCNGNGTSGPKWSTSQDYTEEGGWAPPLPQPLPVQATYAAGDKIDVRFGLTAHHKGHVELHICCDDPPTEDCFTKNKLDFVKDYYYKAPACDAHKEYGFIAPFSIGDGGYEVIGAGPGKDTNATTNAAWWNVMDFKMQFKLPEGVAGDHCLLRWYYVTGNSCNMAGYKKCKEIQELQPVQPDQRCFKPECTDTVTSDCCPKNGNKYTNSSVVNGASPGYKWTNDWLNTGIPDCDPSTQLDAGGTKAPERFWNCVDVKVTGGASDCARKATAEECTPLKRKACKQSTYCKWSGKRRGQCSVAANVCDALQVRRKKRKACAAAGTGCMCSKKKKCGKCKMDPSKTPVGAPAPCP